CIAVPANSTFSIDVTVNSVPSGGTAGGGFDLLFHHSGISATSKNNDNTHSLWNAAASSLLQDFSINAASANSGNDWRIDLIDLDGTVFESGPGALVRITFTAGATAGVSSLTLDDLVGGDGTPDVFDNNQSTYSIGSIVNGTVFVQAAPGDPGCP